MNARQAIQPSNQPAVLSLAFSTSRKRFVAGLADGLRCFNTQNCLTTYQPSLPTDGGLAIAAQHDDRYLAFVGGGRLPAEKDSVVMFWDAVLGKELQRFELYEPILGLKMNEKWLAVTLMDRTVVFRYQQLATEGTSTPKAEDATSDKLIAPNLLHAIYPTSSNPYALAALRNDTLILPAASTGQVHIVPLPGGSKRVIRAHQTSLRCLAISDDGTLLATASQQGTLIRVYKLLGLDQIAEFRRGSDHAIIFDLAFSPNSNRWLACTSDKGTVHIFDLQSPDPGETAIHSTRPHKRTTSYASHRLSGPSGTGETNSLSNFSGRSSPGSAGGGTNTNTNTIPYQGSVQEYYGLRPPPASASPPGGGVGISAMAALKSSPFAPRLLKDTRSVASAPFYMGDDPPHWQGGASHTYTVGPDGRRKKVKNAVPGLPGNPEGRPVKGVIGFEGKGWKGAGIGKDAVEFAGDGEGCRIFVVGGGSDARWEVFELLPVDGGGWSLVNKGFRRYLTRQFVD